MVGLCVVVKLRSGKTLVTFDLDLSPWRLLTSLDDGRKVLCFACVLYWHLDSPRPSDAPPKVWVFLRLCQFWWKSVKKCDRESARRRTDTDTQTQTDFIICPMLYAVAMDRLWREQNSINEYCHVRGHQETNCIDHSRIKHYYQWQNYNGLQLVENEQQNEPKQRPGQHRIGL